MSRRKILLKYPEIPAVQWACINIFQMCKFCTLLSVKTKLVHFLHKLLQILQQLNTFMRSTLFISNLVICGIYGRKILGDQASDQPDFKSDQPPIFENNVNIWYYYIFKRPVTSRIFSVLLKKWRGLRPRIWKLARKDPCPNTWPLGWPPKIAKWPPKLKTKLHKLLIFICFYLTTDHPKFFWFY